MRPLGGRLTNNGATIFMEFYFRSSDVPILSEGPFGGESYKFAFMYFHWLAEEDTAKTNIFMELHMVFTNTRYANYEEASGKILGLVIIAFRHVNNGEKYSNDYYEYLKEVKNPKDVLELDAADTPAIFEVALLVDSYNFYIGKSTYPNARTQCSGDIIWIECDYIFSIMSEEMEIFHSLMSVDGIPLMNRTIATTPPKSAIYKAVDLFTYEQKGVYVAPFEGLGIDVTSSAVGSFNENVASISILFL
uniref:Alpha-carbonic anhydrase domain-containing protein n=1 Tax=Musca domestica TaxID=7370 RepID=A0A1I8NJK1_MUSDO